MATYEIWDNGYGEMGCKDGDGLGKHRQVTTANLRAHRRFKIMGIADKISGEDSIGQEQWRRCGTTGMDTEFEKMLDGNRRYVGRRR